MAKKKITYKFGADLTELEKGFKKIDKSFSNFARKAESHGKRLTAAFTLPLAAIGVAVTKSALSVDKALATIARGTGAQGAALKGLEKDWKALAGQVGDSFEVSAKVLADYNTRLGLTGKSLQEVSKQALDAADMLGEEVNTVVTESAKAMQDWGVASSEMAGYMDKIFVASQQTGVGMAELSTNMYKYGSALRQLGFDVDTTIATLAQFNKQGVNTELVMGSLRIALGKMAKAGITDATEAFKVLTNDIKNAKSPTEATRLAIELFGSKAGPDMAAAIREGRFELGNLTEALNKSKGAIEAADRATETFADRWGETKNKISLAIAPLGKQILQIADEWMPAVEKSINGLNDTIAGMSTEAQKNMLLLAGVFAVGGPLLIGIAAVTNAVRTLMATFVAIAAHPVGAALLVGGAAIGTGYMLGQNMGKYLDKGKPTYTPYQVGQESTGTGDLNSRIKSAVAGPKAFDLNSFIGSLPKNPVIPASSAVSSGSIGKVGGGGGKTAAETALERQIKLAQEAGKETAYAIERMERQNQLQAEVMLAVQEGEAKFNEEMATLATDDARAALDALKLQ
ncbi:MAG: phage tail tape measure protein, partial [Clostridia bacterium]|nr:phage tail tape measure protein [Clostridia bacterium]